MMTILSVSAPYGSLQTLAACNGWQELGNQRFAFDGGIGEAREQIGDLFGAKILAISEIEYPFDFTLEILDPGYTYWSQRGDSTESEHRHFLEHAELDEISEWVSSIARDAAIQKS